MAYLFIPRQWCPTSNSSPTLSSTRSWWSWKGPDFCLFYYYMAPLAPVRERSSGTWHVTLNVNRTTWSEGPFRWSFPPHKSVNNGQKHIAAHALRACSARSLSAFALRSSIHSSGLNLSSTSAPALRPCCTCGGNGVRVHGIRRLT